MSKILSALLLLISLNTVLAADNLTLTKHKDASSIPKEALAMGGGQAMINRTYTDDDQVKRADKVFYTTTHSYNSNLRIDDLRDLLDPSGDRLETLFDKTSVKKSSRAGLYDVNMEISTPIKDFDCGSILNFSKVKKGNKEVFTYTFSNFTRVFTDMTIQVEIEGVGSGSKVRLSQIAAVKGSTIGKLKMFLAVGKFEKALKGNLQKFKAGVGGI